MTKQEVWDVDIYSNLKRVLEESRNEIFVASSWFTDNDLYELLYEKVSDGLSGLPNKFGTNFLKPLF